jgi:hypothetical protein
VTSIHISKTTHAGRRHSAPCSLIGAILGLKSMTSQAQEGAQYLFRQSQQNGCLALCYSRSRNGTRHTGQKPSALFPPRLAGSFFPRGSGLFSVCVLQPPHGAEFFVREKPRVKSTEEIDWCATLNTYECLVSTLCESILI